LVNLKLYNRSLRYLNDPRWDASVRLEHDTALLCLALSETGFPFQKEAATELYNRLKAHLDNLDKELKDAFQPIPKAVKEITPRATAFSTINKSDFRWVSDGDLSPFTIGAPFTLIEW